ncbi:MAG: LTA synthase family protein [Eubacteriales bacterium]|nr:LTA synthase family protein [Eubacteriales bacterium]
MTIDQSKKSRRMARVRETCFVLGSAFITLWLLEGFARGDGGAYFQWIVTQPLTFALNYLFVLGLCFLLSIFRSNRLRVSLTLGLLLIGALFGVTNHYKLLYRLEPILWTDISQLGDAAATVGNLAFDIDFTQIAWICGLFVLGVGLCCWRIRGKAPKRSLWLPLAGLALVCGVPFLCTFSLANGSVRTDMADHARNEGCLYTAFAMENHRRGLMRIDYEEAKVEEAYAGLQQETTPAESDADSPNIIYVLSESFTDESILGRYVDFTDTLMPFYQRFVNECQTGLLYVPKIGGGTSETEFEVLTGIESKYGLNPYSVGLPPMNSLASVLKAKGYTPAVIHWYLGVYYNRYHNLPMLGFDEIYTLDTTDRAFEKQGMFVSDREHYRAITEQMRKTDGKDFVFCLTMQNHGGYGYDDFRQTYGADVPFSNQLSDESEKILANYCYLLRQSDAALEEWIEELREFEEPVLLVFFGDHLAPLGTEVYQELNVPLSGDEAHQTPYLLWSNRETMSGSQNMRAYQLGAYGLTVAGLNDDPFFAYVEKLRQQSVRQDESYDLLCYDALFGKQYAYRQAGLSPASDNCLIGGEMVLTGFDATVIGDGVYVKARLKEKDQSYRLALNGQLQGVRRVGLTEKPFTLQCVLNNYYGVQYNQSNILSYAGTGDLLKRSGSLGYETNPLWDREYETVRDVWYQDYAVYRSKEAYPVSEDTAATVNGKELDWQPVYGIGRAGQYAVDEDGRVYVSISKRELRSSETVKAYLEAGQAMLYSLYESQ